MHKVFLVRLLLLVLYAAFIPGLHASEPRTHADAGSHEDALASNASRPAWAPVPVLRGETSVVPELQKLLRSTDKDTRARSAFLLGQIGDSGSREPLARSLRDSDRGVRIHAGIALACIGDPRGVPACAAALKSGPSWIRYYAVYGLWNIGTPRARTILQRGFDGQDILASSAVRGAIDTWHGKRPGAVASKRNSGSVKLSPADTWSSASDAFAEESDWWWHTGDYEQSIRCNETMIFLEPKIVDNYTTVAWLQWSLGRDAQAVNTLRRAISAAPTDPEAYFGLGLHYFNTKRYTLAEAPLKKALDLGGDQRVRRTYAHCLENLGKLDESLAQWSALLKANPDDAVIRRNFDRVKAKIEAER